tara:strand:- start:985 stop:1170 length:186 start_codon:yes stop_codon:yes gene_type:complete
LYLRQDNKGGPSSRENLGEIPTKKDPKSSIILDDFERSVLAQATEVEVIQAKLSGEDKPVK